MKPFWRDLLLALTMGMLIPGLILHFAVLLMDEGVHGELSEIQIEVTRETMPEKVRMPVLVRGSSGKVTEMDMDEYLVKVVLAEMPAYFEPEALKAQAVVARTYARKAYESKGKHGDGSVCVRPSCCQGYREPENYLKEGGTKESIERIRRAVLATSGQVLKYEGKLIEATYFSCSGGSTEDAEAVWGTEYPYLQAVESPGEENAAYFSDIIKLSLEEFEEKLNLELSDDAENWFGNVSYTPGNGVDTMEIGNQTFQGTKLRSLLGLRSTAFEIEAEENTITVTTRGFGHRVGMSQYGADAMAATGADYREILSHYYQGTILETMKPLSSD